MLSKVRLGLHLLFHLTHSLGTLQCRSAHSLRAHQGLPGEVTMVMGQLVTAIGSCFQSSQEETRSLQPQPGGNFSA